MNKHKTLTQKYSGPDAEAVNKSSVYYHIRVETDTYFKYALHMPGTLNK